MEQPVTQGPINKLIQTQKRKQTWLKTEAHGIKFNWPACARNERCLQATWHRAILLNAEPSGNAINCAPTLWIAGATGSY